MTQEAHGLHMEAVPSRQRPLRLQTALAMALFAILHFYFESLLALSGWLPSLVVGEALMLAVCLLARQKRTQVVVLGAAAALTLVALCLLPDAWDGAKRLINQLFTASEARNRYVYIRFTVSSEALHGEALFRMGLAIIGAILSVIVVNSRSKAGVLLLMALIIGTEIYFGIVPNVATHLLLFLCLTVVLICKDGTVPSPRSYVWLLASALVIGLLIGILFPGVDPALENHSEQLRDWLSQTLEAGVAGGLNADDALNLTRQESMLAEEGVAGTTGEEQDARSYARSLVYQQDISDPRPVDYVRIAVIILLILALLLAPFLPFLWLDRQKRKAAAMRADFDGPDSAQAILTMFRHIVRCLTVFGFSDDNKGFSKLLPADDDRISDAYKEDYRCGALLWREAAYSTHPMTAEQKEMVLSLVNQTEQLVYGLSDRKMRFRMKYIDCLILPEDTA